MSKRVNRLMGLEIDEVSLVDRPANQHGLVTITKRDEDPVDEIFDAQGNLIDPDDLQAGDYFYDDEGNEHRAFTQDQLDTIELLEQHGYEVPDDISELDELTSQLSEEGADDDERELAGVGKSAASAITGGASSAFQAGRKLTTRTLGDLKGGYFHARTGKAPSGEMHSEGARKVGAHFGRNRNQYGAGAAATATGFGAGHHRGRKTATAKSLGASVLESLSKAYTEGDRDQIVSKAVESADRRASAAERRAQVAFAKAQALEDQRELEQYVELAKSYDLPVEANDLGEILQVIAKSGLSDDQLDLVDRIFLAAGETSVYDERGSAGLAPNSVEEVVKAQAYEIIGKSDLTLEQATTALFENNDRAYLEYLAESGH